MLTHNAPFPFRFRQKAPPFGELDLEQKLPTAREGVQGYVESKRTKLEKEYNRLEEKPWFFNPESKQITKM